MTQAEIKEFSLDPPDWDELRALGHRMLDDMLTYLETLRERPVWQDMPDSVRAYFQGPLPESGQDAEAVYEAFLENVLPYPTGNVHPRWWGWVLGSGTPLGALAEMLAATTNNNAVGGNFASTPVEKQVLDWLKAMLGYPAGASGLLVSGGSMANLIGLTVARNAKAEIDLRRQGLALAPRRMVLYASEEAHSSMQRSVEMLGLGSEALRLIPTDDAFEMNLEALKQAIVQDRAAGDYPFCVVGCAGTISTGAFDDLSALADLCAQEGLWLHVDGAFGALAALSPLHAAKVAGMERADSLAFDLHKWYSVNYAAGCVLVRDADAHYHAFTLTPHYLSHGQRGITAGERWFSDFGVELSRPFNALKAWMAFKTNGAAAYRQMVAQNVAQAQYLAELVEAEPALELMAPVPLNIVCFRYKADGLDDAGLNAFNEEVLMRLQESGVAVVSNTTLRGKYCLRAAITNHRSLREDFDLLVRKVVELGDELMAEGPPYAADAD